MFDLSGRLALVTGAGRGIGTSIARSLGERGVSVLVNDLLPEQAAAAAADLADRSDHPAERRRHHHLTPAEPASPVAVRAARPSQSHVISLGRRRRPHRANGSARDRRQLTGQTALTGQSAAHRVDRRRDPALPQTREPDHHRDRGSPQARRRGSCSRGSQPAFSAGRGGLPSSQKFSRKAPTRKAATWRNWSGWPGPSPQA